MARCSSGSTELRCMGIFLCRAFRRFNFFLFSAILKVIYGNNSHYEVSMYW
nr:MAG TPA: hypothetical protein [Caudoviricetes sp.]